jgi:hypothetical protein
VELADWPFDQGLRLVDTPGFTSEIAGHPEATVEALGEAEVAIVVVEMRGMADYVREFVKEHLVGKVPLVAVVLNQLDLVDESDVPDLVRISQRQLREELGLPEAPVLICSAKGAVNAEVGLDGWHSVRQWIESIASAGVEHVVSRRVILALDGLLNDLSVQVRKRLESTSTARAAVAERRTPDAEAQLEQFFGEKAESVVYSIQSRREKTITAIEAAESRCIDSIFSWLCDDSHDVSDEKAVNQTISRLLNSYCKEVNGLLLDFAEACDVAGKKFVAQIDSYIQSAWREVAEFCEDVSAFEFERNSASTSGVINSIHFEVADLPSGFGGVGGGIAVGATIGTFVPVLGTIVGGLIGGVLGWIFGAGHQEAVQKIGNEVDESLKKIRELINDNMQTIIDRSAEAIYRCVSARFMRFTEALKMLEEKLAEEEGRLCKIEESGSIVVQSLEKWKSELRGA